LASCLASPSGMKVDADLRKMIAAWPMLSKRVRQAIMLMAQVDLR
jgi:hypothetical protein